MFNVELLELNFKTFCVGIIATQYKNCYDFILWKWLLLLLCPKSRERSELFKPKTKKNPLEFGIHVNFDGFQWIWQTYSILFHVLSSDFIAFAYKKNNKRYFRCVFFCSSEIIQLYMFTIIILFLLILIELHSKCRKHRITNNPGIQNTPLFIQHFWLKSVAPHTVQRLLSNLTLEFTFEFQISAVTSASSNTTNQPTKPLNIETFNIIPIPVAKAIRSSFVDVQNIVTV